MPRQRFRASNDRDEPHDRPLTTPLIRQRQEQASAYYRQQLYDTSRPSSSSGSAQTYRRTPKFDEPPPSHKQFQKAHARSSSVDSPTRGLPSGPQRVEQEPEPEREGRPASPFHRRAASARPPEFVPHPALRISGRTHSAILYALEEALRKPHPFSEDFDEENAQMSDLGGGRASNGGARTGGPVPVPSSGTPTGLKTPRDVMRNRQEREARRQEEAKAEEQRKLQAEERRRSAERRAAAAGGESRYSGGASQYDAGVPGSRLSGTGQVASGADYGVPTGRMAGTTIGDSGYVSGGPSRRAASASVAQDQPRPAQAQPQSSRRSQSQSVPRQSSAPAQGGAEARTSAAPPVQPPQPTTEGSRNSTFPHAFERWEQLSSHWEGLTSYWLRKLESDAEDIQRNVPSASAMSRQITDLSAAGANLFHAVVELQRLRASSERKFQRWFFETRADTERNQEVRAQLDQQLQTEKLERQKAAKARVESDIAAENARREVAEMRRELMISKEEARRAWEELGRRNQESLELAESLKAGRVTVVSGVQVVPYFGQPSRTGSASQRPTTREGIPYGSTPGPTPGGAAGLRSPGDDEYYQEENSPTNTDPFMEEKPPLHHEPDVSSLAAGTYQPMPHSSSNLTSGASATTIIPPGGTGARPVSSGQLGSGGRGPSTTPGATPSQSFYQHAPQETFLHSSQSLPQQTSNPAATAAAQQLRGQPSYPDDTLSDDIQSSEYVLDRHGNVQLDAHGQPIPFRSQAGGGARSDLSSDDYPTSEELRRQTELAQQYGGHHAVSGQILPPEAPMIPATSAQAMQSYTPTTAPPGREDPDYSGEGFGDDWQGGRQGVVVGSARHHHPTRLSDVLEEEEERSSRRSRAGE